MESSGGNKFVNWINALSSIDFKTKYIYFILCGAILLCHACGRPDVLSLNMRSTNGEKINFSLRDYVSEEYEVLLKPDKTGVLSGYENIYPGSKFIIAYTHNKIYLFSADGSFIKVLANTGRGPGEVSHILDIETDPGQNFLYCVQNNKREIDVFDLNELKYAGQIPLGRRENIHSVFRTGDNSLAGFPVLNALSGPQCFVYLQNDSGSLIKKTIRNTDIKDGPSYMENPVLHKVYGGFLYMPYPLDTVFFIDMDLGIEPVLAVEKTTEKNIFITYKILFPAKERFVFSSTRHIIKDNGAGSLVIYPQKEEFFYIDPEKRTIGNLSHDRDSFRGLSFLRNGYMVKNHDLDPDGCMPLKIFKIL